MIALGFMLWNTCPMASVTPANTNGKQESVMTTKELKFSSIEPGCSFTSAAIGPERYTKVSARKAVIANAYSEAFPNDNAFAVEPNTLVTIVVCS